MPDQSSPPDLKDRVLSALQKGGYALEMRVAAKARRANATVGQSRYYLDPVSGKTREIDVVALWVTTDKADLGPTPCSVVIGLLIECKSKPSPWVVFDENSRPVDPQVDFHYRGTPKVLSPSGKDHFESIILASERKSEVARTIFSITPNGVGSGIVEVPLKGDAEYKSSQPDGAWSAVQGAVSAAIGMQEEWLAKTDPDPHPFPSISLWVPVVVTSGKMFRAWLEGDQMELEEISRASVSVRAGRDFNYIRCYVVTETELDALLQETSNTYRFLMQLPGEEAPKEGTAERPSGPGI